MTDEECLEKFIEFLTDRVTINTKFVLDENDNITHQFLVITCGDFVTVSEPQPLEVILRPAAALEVGATVN